MDNIDYKAKVGFVPAGDGGRVTIVPSFASESPSLLGAEACGAKNALVKDVPAKSGAEASEESIIKKDPSAEAPAAGTVDSAKAKATSLLGAKACGVKNDVKDITAAKSGTEDVLKKDPAAEKAPDAGAVDSDKAEAMFAAHAPRTTAVFWSKFPRPTGPPTAPTGAVEGALKKDIPAAESGAEVFFDETGVIKNDPALKPATKVATALKPAAAGGAPLPSIKEFPVETPAPGDADWTVSAKEFPEEGISEWTTPPKSRHNNERKEAAAPIDCSNGYGALVGAGGNEGIVRGADTFKSRSKMTRGTTQSTTNSGATVNPKTTKTATPEGSISASGWFSWPTFCWPNLLYSIFCLIAVSGGGFAYFSYDSVALLPSVVPDVTALLQDPRPEPSDECQLLTQGVEPVFRPSQLLDCFRTIEWDVLERRTCSLEMLYRQLGQLYGFSGLVRNSSHTDTKIPSRFKPEVTPHEMHLGPEIDRLYEELKDERSMAMFLFRVSQMVKKFEDAHTKVPLPFDFYCTNKIEFGLLAGDDGKTDVTVQKLDGHSDGRIVDMVNGQPALEALLELAKLANSGRKDAGAQLNGFLRPWVPPYPLWRYQFFPPQFEGDYNMSVTLRSGGEPIVRPWECSPAPNETGGFNPPVANDFLPTGDTLDVMKLVPTLETFGFPMLCNYSLLPGTKAPAAEDAPTSVEQTRRAKRVLNIWNQHPPNAFSSCRSLQLQNLLDMDLSRLPLQDILAVFDVKTSFSTKDGTNITAGKVCELPTYCDDEPCWPPTGCSVLFAFEDSAVGRVGTTILELGNEFPSGDGTHMVTCAKVAAEISKVFSPGKLLIDTAGNGGGNIIEGYHLNDYLYRGMENATSFKTPIDSCEWYDWPIGSALSWQVNESLAGFPHPKDTCGKCTRQVVVDLRDRSRDAVNNGVPRYEALADCLDSLLCAYDPWPAKGTGDFDMMSALFDSCLSELRPLPGDAGYTFVGGFDRSNIKPPTPEEWTTLQPTSSWPLRAAVTAPPSWNLFEASVTKKVDAEVSRFTSRHMNMAWCNDYVSQAKEAQTSITEITYLTDGSCGSTCSVSTSRPILDGIASSVSFGGLANTPVDVTSFNGGNVNSDYQEFGRSWADTALDLLTLKGSAMSVPEPEAVILPVPLNTGTEITFAQRAAYPTALGDDAKPREWYRVPAHHHLNVWDEYGMDNFVESEQDMHWRAEKLYIPAAKKPFKTYPGVGEKPPDKCSEPAQGLGQGQIGGRERQLLFSSLPDESKNNPPPAPMPAPLECWPYENPEEQCHAY